MHLVGLEVSNAESNIVMTFNDFYQNWILTESDREPNVNSWAQFLLQCVTWSLFVVIKIFRSHERWYICDIFLKQSYWRKESRKFWRQFKKNIYIYMAQTGNFKNNMSKNHFLFSHRQTSFFVPHSGLSPHCFNAVFIAPSAATTCESLAMLKYCDDRRDDATRCWLMCIVWQSVISPQSVT